MIGRPNALVLSLVVFLAAVMVSSVPAIADDAKAKALMKLDADWSIAAGAKDVDKVVSFYAEDGIAYPPNQPAAVGRENAKKVWAAYFADPTFAISWKTLHAEVAKSGDLGFTSGAYEASWKGADGKPGVEKGKYLVAWELQKDGAWKAIHDIWNADAK